MASPASASTVAKAIHRVQHTLIEGTACTERQLLAAGALLSQPDYADVVLERTIYNICGYPRCPNPLSSDRPRRGHFRIALREHRVYDLEETYKYCSSDCVVDSSAFSESLPPERVADVVSSKVEHVLGLFGHGQAEQPEEELGKDGDLGLFNFTIQEKVDAGTREVSIDQWIGPSNAIEGYVPQQDLKQGSKFSADIEPTKRVDDRGGSELDFTSTLIVGDEVNERNIFEQIAKQLEDMVILDKKTRTNRTSSKSSKSKPTERLNNNVGSEVDAKSTINVGDHVSAAPPHMSSVSMQGTSELGKKLKDGAQLKKKKPQKKTAHKESEDRVRSGKKTGSMGTALKSSLKSSDSPKVDSRSVKWADERIDESLEGMMAELVITDNSKISHEEHGDSPLRLASAEACTAALIQAADSVASGESEAGEAVSDAGIVILPQPQYGDNGNSKANEDIFEFDRGFVKWPKKSLLLDTDLFDVEDSWHDTAPEGFSLTLSPFATIWMALFGWITCSSLAHIYGHDDSSQEDFLLVNGREYPHKIVLRDGKSSEIRRTLDGCIARALPGVVSELMLPIPVSTLGKAVGCLLDTMTFIDAIPSFRTRQWHVIALLFIDALSVHRLHALAPHMTNKDVLIRKVLNAAQVSVVEYESMRDLFMPLGRLPHLSMQCGA